MIISSRSFWVALLIASNLAPGSVQAQTPRSGGILKFAVTAEPPNYDCHAQISFAFVHPVRPHYSSLLKFKSDAYPEIQGDVAESWQVSGDGLSYAFKLRKNVVFHDGSPMTSADIKATYERIINPPQGVISIRRAAYSDIKTIETPDPYTVVFKLGLPNAAMLSLFASPWDCIYSAAKLKMDPKWPEKNILGTGPFKFVGHEAGSHWIGERFKDYFVTGRPYLDGFRAFFIRNSAAWVNAIQAGEITTEFRSTTPAERNRLVEALGDKVQVQESPWICSLVITMNTQKKPFDDARVRRALSLGIDRWKGAEVLGKISLSRHVGGLLRPGYDLAANEQDLVRYPGFDKDFAKSQAEAKRLLKEAGVPNLKFKLTNRNVPQPYTSAGVFLIDQWRQIGVTVEHEQLDTKLYFAALQGADFDAGIDPYCEFMDEPNLQLIKFISADKSTINLSRYNDRQLDDLFERQSRTLDKGERYRIIREFEQRVLDQAYTIPVLWWHRIVVHWKQMHGWHMTPSTYLNQDLTDVWLDQ